MDNWIGNSLRRSSILKHVIDGKTEGRIDVTRRREEEVSSYWMTLRRRKTLEKEALDRNL